MNISNQNNNTEYNAGEISTKYSNTRHWKINTEHRKSIRNTAMQSIIHRKAIWNTVIQEVSAKQTYSTQHTVHTKYKAHNTRCGIQVYGENISITHTVQTPV